MTKSISWHLLKPRIQETFHHILAFLFTKLDFFCHHIKLLFLTLGFFFDISFPPLVPRYDVLYHQKTDCYNGKRTSHPHGGWPRSSNVFESTYPKTKTSISQSVKTHLKTFLLINLLNFWELMKISNPCNITIYRDFV